MLQLGSRAPIAIKFIAAVLVIWPLPHFNCNGLAPVWDWRCFIRGYVVFYAQAMGIQEENQIGRGAAQTHWAGFRAFWSAPIGGLWVYWPV